MDADGWKGIGMIWDHERPVWPPASRRLKARRNAQVSRAGAGAPALDGVQGLTTRCSITWSSVQRIDEASMGGFFTFSSMMRRRYSMPGCGSKPVIPK
jgi:hypothetical protein